MYWHLLFFWREMPKNVPVTFIYREMYEKAPTVFSLPRTCGGKSNISK